MGAYPNCNQICFIQQLMEIDVETHRQTLGGTQKILLKMGRKDCRRQRSQGHHKKPTETGLIGSSRLN